MIKKIVINNIRAISNLTLDINKNLVIITGLNGKGKSTILEAIYYVSTTKSFRTKRYCEMISFDLNFGSIMIYDKKQYKVVLTKDTKKFFINDILTKQLDFIGNIKSIIYTKEDLKAISGSLSDRRRFFNAMISMMDEDYLKSFLEYKKFLRMRNSFIKSNKIDLKMLNAYDEINSKMLYNLYTKKTKFYEKLNYYLREINNLFNYESVTISYDTYTLDEIKANIVKTRSKDIESKTTNFGLHRENINIYIDNNIPRYYSSEGQIKTAILLIKFAVLKIYKEYGYNPIILLDDLFAELDATRQEKVLEYLKDTQTFITSASVADIKDYMLDDALVIDITRKEG